MIYATDFHLRYTIESGQPLTFYSILKPSGRYGSLSYVTSDGFVQLRYKRNSEKIDYSFEGRYKKSSIEDEIRARLGLDHDLKGILSAINTDPFMDSAIKDLYGMRITKNEPWETTLCFVMSQFNNIKRIRGIIQNMINAFGDEFDGRRLFPTPEAIARADIADIRKCGTGFRDRYIKHVAEQFTCGFEYDRLYQMGYEDAKERLMELDGIGDKVADCILLFGYGKYEAFPIDTWVKRVVERAYFKGRKKSVRQIHEFSMERWGANRGYAQQYIFEFGRRNKIG